MTKWLPRKDFLLALCDGDEEVLNHPFDYGVMNHKDPYVLIWRTGLYSGCFSLDEERLAEYILDKSMNGDESEFDIYNKDMKELKFKLNVTVELEEK